MTPSAPFRAPSLPVLKTSPKFLKPGGSGPPVPNPAHQARRGGRRIDGLSLASFESAWPTPSPQGNRTLGREKAAYPLGFLADLLIRQIRRRRSENQEDKPPQTVKTPDLVAQIRAFYRRRLEEVYPPTFDRHP